MPPISPARAEANRRNAQKSTGPRTADGKARVAQNALKHGLRAERNPLHLAADTTLPIDRDEFLATLTAFIEQFQPATPLETRLVERLAQIDVRLNRATRTETALLDRGITSAVKFNQLAPLSAAHALNLSPGDLRVYENHMLASGFTNAAYPLGLLARHQTRLSREFARTLTQLNNAQSSKAQLHHAQLSPTQLDRAQQVEAQQHEPQPIEAQPNEAQPNEPQQHKAQQHQLHAPRPAQPPFMKEKSVKNEKLEKRRVTEQTHQHKQNTAPSSQTEPSAAAAAQCILQPGEPPANLNQG